jgi:hypothetical protein
MEPAQMHEGLGQVPEPSRKRCNAGQFRESEELQSASGRSLR